jgi:ribosomal protein S18 acetylase RimI-like enzyme
MLETQNTNVPAILFYRRQGFEIDGLQFSQYDGEPGEQAVFMTDQLEF